MGVARAWECRVDGAGRYATSLSGSYTRERKAAAVLPYPCSGGDQLPHHLTSFQLQCFVRQGKETVVMRYHNNTFSCRL